MGYCVLSESINAYTSLLHNYYRDGPLKNDLNAWYRINHCELSLSSPNNCNRVHGIKVWIPQSMSKIFKYYLGWYILLHGFHSTSFDLRLLQMTSHIPKATGYWINDIFKNRYTDVIILDKCLKCSRIYHSWPEMNFSALPQNQLQYNIENIHVLYILIYHVISVS